MFWGYSERKTEKLPKDGNPQQIYDCNLTPCLTISTAVDNQPQLCHIYPTANKMIYFKVSASCEKEEGGGSILLQEWGGKASAMTKYFLLVSMDDKMANQRIQEVAWDCYIKSKNK